MTLTPRIDLGDERGTTLVELLVGLMMGMIILTALTLVVVVTLHASARVSARVEATQDGRIALARVTEELHSACIYPKTAPVKGGASNETFASTGNKLVFVHAANSQGQAVAPTPIRSVVSLANGELKQSDYPASGGSAPNWTFSGTATSTRTLMEGVAPIPGRSAIFAYYYYSNGGLVEQSASPSLSATEAAKTIDVRVALNASPRTTPVKDNGADTSIQDSAVLRLTPPSFNESATALPCQ
jgi:Tfp pilus assembly protein PilE